MTRDEVIRYVNRILVRNPQFKSCFEDKDFVDKRKKYSMPNDKSILITENRDAWKWFILPRLLDNNHLKVVEVDVSEALDIFVGNMEDTPSLSDLRADIIVIHDGRLKMDHQQKDVILARLWDLAPVVLYEWMGDRSSYNSKSRLDKMLGGVELHEPVAKNSTPVSRVDGDLF